MLLQGFVYVPNYPISTLGRAAVCFLATVFGRVLVWECVMAQATCKPVCFFGI